MKINKTACKTCPFEGENPIDISAESKTAITEYVIEGQNHLCHQDDSNNTICRGGRNLFLKVAASAGIISEPTFYFYPNSLQG